MSFLTFLFPKVGHKSRSGAVDGYPYDLDASLRYTRFKTGIDRFPIQDNGTVWTQLGRMNGGEGVSGLLPQQDHLVWAQGYGRYPSGPIVSALPENLNWQITVPGLSKMDGQ